MDRRYRNRSKRDQSNVIADCTAKRIDAGALNDASADPLKLKEKKG